MSYAQDARDADAAFRTDGQLIAIKREVKGAYANGRVPVTTVNASAWGIETQLTSRDYGVTVAPGTLIQSGDRKLLMSVFDNVGAPLPQPQVGDIITLGAQTYTVKFTDRTAPAGIAVMYTLVVRI
jgi:hypothetical protein